MLMIAEIPDMTEEVYAGMVEQLTAPLRAAEGFISHSGGPSPTGGWRVVETWESEEFAQQWFEQSVKPNLPPGVVPDRTYHPVHSAFVK